MSLNDPMAIFVRGLDREWWFHGARINARGPFDTESAALRAAVQAGQVLGVGAFVQHRGGGTDWLTYWSYGDPEVA